MGPTKFAFAPPPKSTRKPTKTSNLYVANCGPAVGLSLDAIARAFSQYGSVRGVYPADDTGTRVVVSYDEESSAENALRALDGCACCELGNRVLHVRYSVHRTTEPVAAEVQGVALIAKQQISLASHGIEGRVQFPRPRAEVRVGHSVPVALDASELNIPGIYLLHDFVSPKEEEELLAAIDERAWKSLAKRRVQHYGYEFCYDIRNVNTNLCLGNLPSFVSPILERIKLFPDINSVAETGLDQLTVNEYPPGVGLSPHIDTHSAFEGLIFSLSLAGPCIMEFRRYSDGAWVPQSAVGTDVEERDSESSNCIRKAIFLPPRSMLLLSGEGRYAWNHYIPHHKIDMVNNNVIKRSSRRVSFTLRKVRTGPCRCKYPQYCDSQKLMKPSLHTD